MNDQVVIAAIYSGAFLLLFVIGELLYYGLKLKPEVSRKIVHVFTGLICLTFPLYVTTHWVVLFLCISFVLILVVSIKFKFLKSINAVERKTGGSYLFPISIYTIYWAYSWFGHDNNTASNVFWNSDRNLNGILSDDAGILYFLPLLIFSLADPAAALVGRRWPLGKYKIGQNTKTFAGSAGFFVVAAILCFAFCNSHFENFSTVILVTFSVALATTIAEGVSSRGLDNLSIPAIAIIVLILFK